MIQYSDVDTTQTLKYKKMVGLTNIDGNTVNTRFVAQTTLQGSLYIANDTLLYNNTTITSDLTLSGISIFNDDLITNIISTNSFICNNINSASLLTSNMTTNTCVVLNNITTNEAEILNLSVSGDSVVMNNLKSRYIEHATSLSIHSDVIEFGLNSNIVINGNNIFANTSSLEVYDKSIYLNSARQYDAKLAGINIQTASGNGYIKTSPDGSRYIIKAPAEDSFGYITTVDYDNNLVVSGTTLLYGPATVFSTFSVADKSVIAGNVIFNNNLYTSGNTVFLNTVSVQSFLCVSGNTIMNNSVTTTGNLNIGSRGLMNGPVTTTSDININGNTTVTGSLLLDSNLNINGECIIDGIATFGSKLLISGNTTIGGNTTTLSDVNIYKNLNINGTAEINGIMNISDVSIFGSDTQSGHLNVNNDVTFQDDVCINGNITYGSSNLYIYSQLISCVTEYDTNEQAVLNGVPIWGFYRTGGILKVCLSSILPVITLYGSDNIYIIKNSPFIEPGTICRDVEDGIIQVYIQSIGDLILNPSAEANINSIIYDTQSLDIGSYIITYVAIDNDGNYATPKTRILNIVDI